MYHYRYQGTTPNTPGPISKMSVNRPSTMCGPVSRLMNTRFGSYYTYWNCWHPVYAKGYAARSLPHFEMTVNRASTIVDLVSLVIVK